MKWKNYDNGPGYYYITGTLTEWLPLLAREDIRRAVYYEINLALRRYNASLAAFVVMPTHLHLLVCLPEAGLLHGFCKCWRGRSARHIIDMLVRQGDQRTLEVMARHANGGCKYAAWKEQPRVLPTVSKTVLRIKIDYIHANPVRSRLVAELGDWPHSSWVWYENGQAVALPITPPEELI